jgi:hypothetical protein
MTPVQARPTERPDPERRSRSCSSCLTRPTRSTGTSGRSELMSSGISEEWRGLRSTALRSSSTRSIRTTRARPVQSRLDERARIELFVDDPDELLARALSAGATLGSPIEEHVVPWGTHRQGGFQDPFGHNWSVGDRSPLRAETTRSTGRLVRGTDDQGLRPAKPLTYARIVAPVESPSAIDSDACHIDQ